MLNANGVQVQVHHLTINVVYTFKWLSLAGLGAQSLQGRLWGGI